MEMETSWNNLVPVLQSIYFHLGRGHLFDSDLQYLSKAFEEVEHLWYIQAKASPELRLVMLSEAPAFGPKHLYFYNPGAMATEFFSYLDAEALVGSIPGSSKLVNGIRPRKALMIDKLTSNGFLILDLFPFALNRTCTRIDYKTLRKKGHYHRLFIETFRHYLSPKLKLLATKPLQQRPTFVFRYAGLRENLQEAVEGLLVSHDFLTGGQRLESVHNDRNVDRNRLAMLFKTSFP
jgi:hypothetical protein